MNVCELCHDLGIVDCKHCEFGNPCLGCDDYDEDADKCRSNGGCARTEEADNEVD